MKGPKVSVPPEARHWSLPSLTVDVIEALYRVALACLSRRPVDDPQRVALEQGDAQLQFCLPPHRAALVVALAREEAPPEVLDVIAIDHEDPSTFGRTARELMDASLAASKPS